MSRSLFIAVASYRHIVSFWRSIVENLLTNDCWRNIGCKSDRGRRRQGARRRDHHHRSNDDGPRMEFNAFENIVSYHQLGEVLKWVFDVLITGCRDLEELEAQPTGEFQSLIFGHLTNLFHVKFCSHQDPFNCNTVSLLYAIVPDLHLLEARLTSLIVSQ